MVVSTSWKVRVATAELPVALPPQDPPALEPYSPRRRTGTIPTQLAFAGEPANERVAAAYGAANNPTYEAVIAAIRIQPLPAGFRIAKRGLDVIGSAIGLVALLPVLAIIALAVKLSSRGPVLFFQDRCGLGGRRFRFYKFRTMIANAEQHKRALAQRNEMAGPVFKIRKDPRVTRLGRVLRKLSLDELPQLWNVLLGHMSLVGPRPPTPDEVTRYNPRHVQRLAVVPGITGLWQVSGRSDIVDFERWIDLDLEYVRRSSLWMDLRILCKTIVVVVSTRGAH